jgi:catechol 2,3-dioxygenase-like lactoylglutathione lyase family enzyme
MGRPNTHVPQLRRLTPVLVVESVEACIGFWTERLGFAITHQVAGPGDALVFVSVEKDGIEVMLQTRASVLAERADAAAELDGHSIVLFIEVADLDAIERALDGVITVKPRHRTFYGSSELHVREPGGNVVGFAQFG